MERGGQDSHRSSLKWETSSPRVPKAIGKFLLGYGGDIQLYAVATAALVGICCLVVTRRNQCFCASLVTCRFEAVANEA